MADEGQEKSHEPTERRRQKFKEKGEVPRSKEVTAVMGLGLATVILTSCMHRIALGMGEAFTLCFESMREPSMDSTAALQLAGEVSFSVMGMLIGPLFMLWLGALVVGLIQGRGAIPKEPIKFELEKLNPLPGIQRLFMSSTPLVELVKSLFKLGLIGWLVWTALEEKIGLLPELSHVSVWDLLEVHEQLALMVVMRALPVAILIAIIDYGHQWWMLHEKMMMTHEEVKEEHKDVEGDPHLRAARKARQREISAVRAITDTRRADVVVTNPTHYAVALRYQVDEAPAPVVIARGVDHLALKIKQEARRHDIPIVENRSLARALYAQSKVGRMIPDDLFGAVAHVLAVIIRRRNARVRNIRRRRQPVR